MDDWHHPSTADGCPGCNCCELPDCTREHRVCPGQAEIISDGGATLTIRTVPACTTCGLIGHLAEDCTKS